MKILALDTATEACSAAVLVDGKVVERFEVLGRGHAERLLPMVQEVLAEAGLALAALDAIAFGRGPGGFTGLRIAAGVTQGLAYGAGLPVVPVSDLAALATRSAVQHGQRYILSCLDARMAQVYWAVFDCESPHAPRVLVAEAVTDPDRVAQAIHDLQGDCGPLFGAGHGFGAYPALHTMLGERLAGFDADLLPRAREIALIAAGDFAAGRVVDARDAVPVYLRDEVAHRR